MNNNQKGFTLIELMITVAIVAILASVAYASYSTSVQKSRRADAKDALVRAAALQEQRYTAPPYQYTSDLTAIGGSESKDGHYDISVALTQPSGADCPSGSSGVNRCFTLTATAQGSQLEDETCNVFTLDNLGRKEARSLGSTTPDTTDICW